MFPSVNINDYYLQFKRKALKEYNEAYKLRETLNTTHAKLKEVVINNKEHIKKVYGLDFNKYAEFTKDEYNPSNALLTAIGRCVSICNNDIDKVILQKCIAYCTNINRLHSVSVILDNANMKRTMKKSVYKDYVRRYYEEVHRQMLLGNGYKFTSQLGTIVINRWKTKKPLKQVIDYRATNIRKKELLDKGVKLYDANEAAWYEARHIPYDAVDYRVFKQNSWFYEITFINTKAFGSKYEFEHSEYINKKLRGLTHEEMADKYCHTFDDIVKLPVDIKVKLNILIYKDPNKYLNFVRNADQYQHKHRADNR